MENLFARIFQLILQLMGITLYMLVEIVRSSFTGRGDPWIVELHIFANENKSW